LAIWSGDIIGSLGMGGYLREDISYDDKLNMYALVDAEVKGICAALTPSAPIAAPVRDDGARGLLDQIEQFDPATTHQDIGGGLEVVGWQIRNASGFRGLAFMQAVERALASTPASDVPGDAQTQEGDPVRADVDATMKAAEPQQEFLRRTLERRAQRLAPPAPADRSEGDRNV
jgi:hypothetical protein